jgi:predicted outer membrane protein
MIEGHRPERRHAAALTVAGLLLLALGGCQRADRDGTGLSTDRFADVVVAIREAELAAQYSDSAAAEFERRKAEILAEHDVTDAELRDYLARHDDVESLVEIWDTLNQRLKHVPPRHDPSLNEIDGQP